MRWGQLQKTELTGRGLSPLVKSLEKWSLISAEKIEVYLFAYLNFSLLNSEYVTYIIQENDDKYLTGLSLDWYYTFAKNHEANLSRNEMAEIIKGVHNLIRTNKLKLLDDILKNTLNSYSSIESIVCLLRSSAPVKNKLKNWRILLNNAKVWIESKGRSPEKVLIGMY